MAFLGEESQWASEASECANDQGAFWQYHDKLFESQNGENQGAFNKDKLKGFAKDLGLKSADFDACLDSGKYTQLVQQQTEAAQSLGVQSTPSFFVNDWLVLGALPVEQFDSYIAKAKAGQHPAPTPTPLPQGTEFWQADPNRTGRNYDGSYYLGDAKAPVVILAFEDFKSPDSAEHVKSVETQLKSDYLDKGLARYVVQLYPLNAPRAAVAALCAGQQNKFFEFRNLLLTKQAEWTEGDDAAMQAYAKSLGLDEAAFASCLQDEKVQQQVEQFVSFGKNDIQVPQAPSYLMLKINAQGTVENAKGFPGALPLDQFVQGVKDISVPPTPTPTPPPSISESDLASLPVGRDADGNFYRGDLNAPVKLVEFSDFQCPYCASYSTETEPRLYEAYMKAGKVVQVFRNFPLDSIHPNAPAAARAGICIGDQSAKLFWEMHDWFFANQAVWEGASDAAAQFRAEALVLGADSAKYDACIADPKTEEKLQSDVKAGGTLGVSGTPAFFLYTMQGGKEVGSPTPLSGAQPFAQFSAALDKLLVTQ